MSTIQSLWQSIETQYNNGSLSDEQLEKIDSLVLSDDIEDIRNGLMLLTSIAVEYLCRYLKLDGESVILRDADRFSAPSLTERVLVRSAKSALMWQELYDSRAFGTMEFRALGDVKIENLSESEKEFCVRMAKELVRVPAGKFMMGALEDDEDARPDEYPRHQVTLTKDFMVMKYPVTQALWEHVMGNNPSEFYGANRPVETVTWFDCILFCNKFSELEGFELVYTINGDDVTCNRSAKGYRLLTEAEWEYSARGGEYHKYAGSDNIDEVAWYGEDWDEGATHPVGLKKPNGFGLYDMSGNVNEWGWDRMEYDQDKSALVGDSVYSHDPVTDPFGSDVGLGCVVRAGCWGNDPDTVRTSYRHCNGRGGLNPLKKGRALGFRVVRSL